MTAKTGFPHHFLPLRSVTYPSKVGIDLRTSYLSLLLDMHCLAVKLMITNFSTLICGADFSSLHVMNYE